MSPTAHILPLIHRHAADVAWYFLQFNTDRASFLVDFDRLWHYQRIFSAHVDGLLTAKEIGRQIALDRLARWKGAGELFVCCYVALHAHDMKCFASAWAFLLQNPQPHYIHAAASALLWLPTDKVIPAYAHLIATKNPLALQLVLAAQGLRREKCALDSLALFQHESAALRAEICCYAGMLRFFKLIPQLRHACNDQSRIVREQAAVALLLCSEPTSALPELYAAVQHYAALVVEGQGAAAIRAEGRAQHLACLLGHALPFPCSEPMLRMLLAELPPYLLLLTLAHHGNPALVEHLLPFLRQENQEYEGEHHAGKPGKNQGSYARRSLWALCFITGLEANEDLLLHNPPSSADYPPAAGLDQDAGLPEPDPQAVEQWWQKYKAGLMPAQAPVLAGQSMSDASAVLPLLSSGFQAQRFAAALHMTRLNPQAPWLDTRSPIAHQQVLLQKML